MSVPVYAVMPFSESDAAAARKAHFSFVCSMCEHLHAGRKRLHTDDWANVFCTGHNCCGPIGSEAYPQYRGPLEGLLDRFCWQCGLRDPGSVISPKHQPDRLLGCCAEHRELLQDGVFEARPASEPKKQIVNIFGNEVEL